MYDDERKEYPEKESYRTGETSSEQPDRSREPNFIMRDPQPSGENGSTAEDPSANLTRCGAQNGWQQQYRRRDPYYQESHRAQYQETQYRETQYQNNRPQNTQRQSTSKAGKFAGIAAAAILFGTVAGGTMFGVNTLGEAMKGRYVSRHETVTEETQASLAQTETQSGSSGSTTAGAAVITAVQNDVSAIVEQAMPSVVAINSTMAYQQQTWFGQSQTIELPSSGSGIIVGQNDDELLIVTNNHVVADSRELSVTFIDDSQVKAAIKGTDPDSDLAVVAIPLKDIPAETMGQIKAATLGDSDELKVGQGVIAIGNALGYGQSVTVGYVSALDREVKAEDQTVRNLLQTDAAINPGNSGGALLNMKGEVIGINAAKYSSTEIEGMGYAIPISKAQDIISELMNLETRTVVDEKQQGYLGIQGQNIDETASAMYGMPRGVYIYKIVEGGAAQNSDLREKDIITKFDGRSVRSMQDLQEMLTYYEGGSTITLTVQSLENGEYMERQVEITLGYKPSAGTN